MVSPQHEVESRCLVFLEAFGSATLAATLMAIIMWIGGDEEVYMDFVCLSTLGVVLATPCWGWLSDVCHQRRLLLCACSSMSLLTFAIIVAWAFRAEGRKRLWLLSSPWFEFMAVLWGASKAYAVLLVSTHHARLPYEGRVLTQCYLTASAIAGAAVASPLLMLILSWSDSSDVARLVALLILSLGTSWLWYHRRGTPALPDGGTFWGTTRALCHTDCTDDGQLPEPEDDKQACFERGLWKLLASGSARVSRLTVMLGLPLVLRSAYSGNDEHEALLLFLSVGLGGVTAVISWWILPGTLWVFSPTRVGHVLRGMAVLALVFTVTPQLSVELFLLLVFSAMSLMSLADTVCTADIAAAVPSSTMGLVLGLTEAFAYAGVAMSCCLLRMTFVLHPGQLGDSAPAMQTISSPRFVLALVCGLPVIISTGCAWMGGPGRPLSSPSGYRIVDGTDYSVAPKAFLV